MLHHARTLAVIKFISPYRRDAGTPCLSSSAYVHIVRVSTSLLHIHTYPQSPTRDLLHLYVFLLRATASSVRPSRSDRSALLATAAACATQGAPPTCRARSSKPASLPCSLAENNCRRVEVLISFTSFDAD